MAISIAAAGSMGSPNNSYNSLVVLMALAVCLLSFSRFVAVRGDDPAEPLDFCVAVLRTGGADTHVWQTGTEDESRWKGASDPSQMGVASAANVTTDLPFPCKNVSTVTAKDFTFSGLAKAQKVTSKLGSVVTRASVDEFPAVNTLGISVARIDYVKNGLNPPHQHPRATELLYVLSGRLLVGFVDTSNTLFQQTLETGDVFVFPEGLLHFQMEVGWGPASAFVTFDSQNPGTLQAVTALLGSHPQISPDVIETSLAIDKKTLGTLECGFSETLH